MGIVGVEHDHQWLEVSFGDGTAASFLGTWLRDNIPAGRHRGGGQRTFDINSMPEVTLAGASHDTDSVTVSFDPEGLDAMFDEAWLRHHDPTRTTTTGVNPPPTLWTSDLQGSLEFVDFEALLADSRQLRGWLVGLRDYGFGLVENVPTTPGSITRVVDLFGYLRQTNYGNLFEVRDEPDPANLANTRLGIGMHTDNPYRDPVPGLQLLHCLVNGSNGGDSQLCDGFTVAERLRSEDSAAFELLSSQPVRFRFLDEGSTDLQAIVPLIQLDTAGQVVEIRYNSRSIQEFAMPPDVMAGYYRAYRVFGEMLHDPRARIDFRLDPGQLMVFDNQRVLHGRSAYEQGERHLQGCYADKDALHSRIRVLDAA
jgi:gamma-butyrobetaine dioxygenase